MSSVSKLGGLTVLQLLPVLSNIPQPLYCPARQDQCMAVFDTSSNPDHRMPLKAAATLAGLAAVSEEQTTPGWKAEGNEKWLR
jgi:hypothetical protein